MPLAHPTVMYYDRYPEGHITENCLCWIYVKKETTQVHTVLDIFCYFPWHKSHNTLQKLT